MKKNYNWAILGAGSIAEKFASDIKLLHNAKLFAVGSRSLGRAEKFASSHNIPKAYGRYEEMVNDPLIDIVYISSRHVSHYSNSILCLNHGKAVLCEKPVSINKKQFSVMMDTANKNNQFFMEALWTRFIPSFKKCKELVENGTIGDIKLIESDFCFKAYFDKEGRLFNPYLGGGALLDIGIYPVFFALEMAGKPIEIEAFARIGETKVDESCTIQIKHENGILSSLFCSITTNGRTEAIVHGTKGMIRINREWHTPSSIDLFLNDEEPVHYSFDESGFGYQYEAEEVMNCLDKGLTESSLFGWQKSFDLISALDSIRNKAGIVYPPELEIV
jgi:predicted dehydrogenase